MGHKHTRRLPSRQAERRIVKMAGEAVRDDFPNPERIACPSSDAIHAVVGKHIAFPDFDNIVDHIATCTPCFEEYNRQRQRIRHRNAVAALLTCAALLILGLLWNYGPIKHLRPKEPVAKELPATIVAATLDYSHWTAQRSAEPGAQSAETPHLTRGPLNLTIKLPIGTEDGAYTVQFRSSNDTAVAEADGMATWDGTAEVLKIRTDLRNIATGAYTVAIRSASSSLRLYPVVLE